MKAHLLFCLFLVPHLMSPAAGAQLLSPREPTASHGQQPRTNQQKAEEEKEEVRFLLDQILDLEIDEPYESNSTGWGGTLLPEGSFRIPEHERIYPPGYLERRRQQQVEAVQ